MAVKISGYLPILLQLVAPRMKVNLRFDNISTGAAQKNEVVITNSVLQMRDRVKAEIMALGLLCHEGLGHIRQTDWKVWDAFCKKHPEGKDLLNVVEDARIERFSWITYPGVKSMLHDVCEALLKDGKLTLPAGQVQPGDALIGGLLHVLRGEHLDQPMDAPGGRKLLADTFGQQTADEIITLAFEGANAKTTELATKPVMEILKKLKMLSQQQPQPQPGAGASQPGTPPPSQNGQGQGQGQGQGKPDPQNQSGQANGKANGKGSGKGAQPAPADPQQQAKNAADALSQMGTGQVTKTDLGNVIQQVVDQSPQHSYGGGSTPYYGPISVKSPTGTVRTPGTDVLSASRRMASRLEQLMAARVDDDDRMEYSGELDGNLVAKVKLLDTQVFRQESDESDGIDSAVLLLLDASGSMSDPVEPKSKISRAELCFNAAWASSSAMAKFKPHGVEMAIWSYGDHLTKFVDFGGWSFQKEKFQRYSNGGSTATFPACVAAIGELAKQQQKRKHLIVFSDGDLGGEPTEKHLKEAMKAGIEVSVIFIGDKGVKPSDVSDVLKDRVYIVHNTESIVSSMFACLKPH